MNENWGFLLVALGLSLLRGGGTYKEPYIVRDLCIIYSLT